MTLLLYQDEFMDRTISQSAARTTHNWSCLNFIILSRGCYMLEGLITLTAVVI